MKWKEVGHSLIPTEVEVVGQAQYFPDLAQVWVLVGEIVNGKCMISAAYYLNVAARGGGRSGKDVCST